jgi:hypothetical protein
MGSSVDLWPVAATPRLLRADLPSGLAFGVALGLTLLLRGSREKAPKA